MIYIQDWPKVISNYYILNSYYLGESIYVVGNEELILFQKGQGLQHGGKPKNGNNYVFKCKHLNLSCVLCSHIEKEKHFKYL
jgi:hypothetical protein